jgi:hypothetical protein
MGTTKPALLVALTITLGRLRIRVHRPGKQIFEAPVCALRTTRTAGGSSATPLRPLLLYFERADVSLEWTPHISPTPLRVSLRPLLLSGEIAEPLFILAYAPGGMRELR